MPRVWSTWPINCHNREHIPHGQGCSHLIVLVLPGTCSIALVSYCSECSWPSATGWLACCWTWTGKYALAQNGSVWVSWTPSSNVQHWIILTYSIVNTLLFYISTHSLTLTICYTFCTRASKWSLSIKLLNLVLLLYPECPLSTCYEASTANSLPTTEKFDGPLASLDSDCDTTRVALQLPVWDVDI